MQSHEMQEQADLKMVASKLIDATALIGHVSKELSFKHNFFTMTLNKLAPEIIRLKAFCLALI